MKKFKASNSCNSNNNNSNNNYNNDNNNNNNDDNDNDNNNDYSVTNQVNNQSLIPLTDVIQLKLTLKMTTAEIVEASVIVNNIVQFRTTPTRKIILSLLTAM